MYFMAYNLSMKCGRSIMKDSQKKAPDPKHDLSMFSRDAA